MKKLPAFFFGMLVGSILMFVTLKYHIVRSQQGLHIVPKSAANLSLPYVDIREFSIQDWNEYRQLAADIAQSDEAHLLEATARSSLDNTIRDVLDGFGTDARP